MENHREFSTSSQKLPEVGNHSDVKLRVFSSSSELVEKFHEARNALGAKPYAAMYSSHYGGIILDPAMMVLPIDDHMVHRGHGLCDSAIIFNGYLYEMDDHLDRFLRSLPKVKLSSPLSRAALRSIIIQLVAVSKCKEGIMKYWLSAGPGDFSVSNIGCPTSVFYAVVIPDKSFEHCDEGVKVITSSIPIKPPLFATVKNVDYLPNVLAKLEAEEKGAFSSIWMDDEGYIAEGTHMNVAFITKEKEFVMPLFDKILPGCTAKRLLELASNLVEQGLLKGVANRNITLEEAKSAAEMMYINGMLLVLPIIVWDDQPVGNGKVGELTKLLSKLLFEDRVSGPKRIPVPYDEY